jgi:tRNA(Ile)-lysidine synthase
MANRVGPGVVAVSGGADSVALLRVLHSLSLSLTVAHVNHQLRGAASDADEAFVRDLCTSLGIPCRLTSADVAVLAQGENLEATARRIRYEFFAEVAAECRAAWIATGHSADDQAETVLHRIIRGTGIQGLRGIASVRGQRSETRDQKKTKASDSDLTSDFCPLTSVPLLRPLLTNTRAEIIEYLAALKQPFREDASNADPRFTRNRIRHELLPLLKTFNPDIVAALAHLAEHAEEAHEIIAMVAGEALAKAERPRAGNTIILDIAALGPSRAMIRSGLRFLWEREGWPASEMGFDAWDRAVAVALGDIAACDFPGGISMRHAGRVVQIESSKFRAPSSKSGS